MDITTKARHSLSLFLLLLTTISFRSRPATAATTPPSVFSAANFSLPSDAVALLSFKSTADLDHKLLFSLNERFDYCQWRGVSCLQGRVIRFVLQGIGLRGVFAPNTLSLLDQVRILSLQNNSLFGPVPDLSRLVNLKSLFLDHNSFSGNFPPSILSLHRLRILDLSYNNLSGSIPAEITGLDRLSSLQIEWNRFTGSVPPLNQSSLRVFNVSGNNLTGRVPVTPTLSLFNTSSFFWNPNLCGEIVNRVCDSTSPFFRPNGGAVAPSTPFEQTAESQGVVDLPQLSPKKRRTALILGFCFGVVALIGSLLCFLVAVKKQRNQRAQKPTMASLDSAGAEITLPPVAMEEQREDELEIKLKKVKGIDRAGRSCNLVFCAGETPIYNLEQLMRASAEMLGRGTIGTTYKAVLDNQLIVSVKRLDATKTSVTSSEVFERHMESVGGLRHPNLVPLRAYFQAKDERLIIYDYQPNGSLFSLIHGSRSSRAKPLHWTSCLKIAEDVAQGLAYIHQASRLIHGNLKSSNILLGSEFEACLTDYCLSILSDSSTDDPEAAAYKAPEVRKNSRRATSRSDVYSFGILLLELLTGKPPSQHPFLVPTDMANWVRAIREDDGGEDNQLRMLIEVASVCSLASPEQRPGMWQVLKMIQEIKEIVMMEDNVVESSFGIS